MSMLSKLLRPLSVGRLIGITIAVFAFGIVISAQQSTAATEVASGVYTLNADFDKGSLINVVHTPSDQLQLTEQVNTFNFIWVAVSTKGTVVKINTDSGAIVGEYKTSPSSQGNGDPSRTTVDKDGSVWLSNRSNVFNGTGSVIHIGLVENGQCEDRNGNGVIDTSTAQNDIRDWTDASGARNVATAADECIVHYVQVPNASGTRHVSVDSQNNVWVAGYYSKNFDLIKGGKWNVPNSGTIIRSETSVGYGGYGGLIDPNGVIWSANGLLRWDTTNPLTGPNGTNWTGYGHNSYGLCIDSQGNVWNTALTGDQIRKFAPDGTLLGTFSHGNYYAQGCVADKNDHIWIAHSILGPQNTVGHILNNGTFIGNVTVGSGPTGVAVDANGKIWSTDYNSGIVSRINPNAGPVGADAVTKIGEVDFTSVALGGNPYNYSDMTGSTLSGKAENGTWTVIHDGLVSGKPWKDIAWNASVPADGALTVTVATSDNGVTFGAPQTVTNGQSLTTITSRYLKVEVSFVRGSRGVSPILYDLTLNSIPAPVPTPTPTPIVLGDEALPALSVEKSISAAFANPGGTISYSVVITNSGDAVAEGVTLVDTLAAGLHYTDTMAMDHSWIIGDLEAGASKTITYQVKVNTNATAGNYVNTAVVWAAGVDNVTDTATLEVREPAVLGAEDLPVTGGSELPLLLSSLSVIGAAAFVYRKRK